MEASFLRETLQRGHYQLSDEQSILKARATARNRIKWLKKEPGPDSLDEGTEHALFTTFSTIIKEVEKMLGV